MCTDTVANAVTRQMAMAAVDWTGLRYVFRKDAELFLHTADQVNQMFADVRDVARFEDDIGTHREVEGDQEDQIAMCGLSFPTCPELEHHATSSAAGAILIWCSKR